MEKSLEEMEDENAALAEELSITEKKAKLAELKRMYGNDYKRIAKGMLGGFKGMMTEPPSVFKGK